MSHLIEKAIFSANFMTDVQDLLTANYSIIETQVSGFNYNSEVVKMFTFSLVDLNNPFRL